MDGAFAAVRFPSKDGFKEKDNAVAANTSEDIISLLQDCRLMRKDDLQVCEKRKKRKKKRENGNACSCEVVIVFCYCDCTLEDDLIT